VILDDTHAFGDERRGRLLVQALEHGTSNPMFVTIYYRDTGPATTYGIDAREAVTKFPDLWSFEPWPKPRK
jgi:hypothetical protein